MFVGYIVLYVNKEASVEDLFLNGGVIYETWDMALKNAHILAEEKKEEFGSSGYYVISVAKSDSKYICDTKGKERVYILQNREIGLVGEIFIVQAKEVS